MFTRCIMINELGLLRLQSFSYFISLGWPCQSPMKVRSVLMIRRILLHSNVCTAYIWNGVELLVPADCRKGIGMESEAVHLSCWSDRWTSVFVGKSVLRPSNIGLSSVSIKLRSCKHSDVWYEIFIEHSIATLRMNYCNIQNYYSQHYKNLYKNNSIIWF